MDQPPIDTIVTVGPNIPLSEAQFWRGRDEVSGARVYVRVVGGPWHKLGEGEATPDRGWTAISKVSVAGSFTGYEIGIADYWKPSGNYTYPIGTQKQDGTPPGTVTVIYDGNGGVNGYTNLQMKFYFDPAQNVPVFP